jgi:hypothetical protein
LKNNQKIKGIQIDGTGYLLSQYADDTLIILDGSEKSLRETIKELNNWAKNKYMYIKNTASLKN